MLDKLKKLMTKTAKRVFGGKRKTRKVRRTRKAHKGGYVYA